jgi:hypothetical protein
MVHIAINDHSRQGKTGQEQRWTTMDVCTYHAVILCFQKREEDLRLAVFLCLLSVRFTHHEYAKMPLPRA